MSTRAEQSKLDKCFYDSANNRRRSGGITLFGRPSVRSSAVPCPSTPIARDAISLYLSSQVCASTSVDDAALAVDRLAGCVTDVGALYGRAQAGYIASNTQVMWLGHKNQIDKINIRSTVVNSHHP